VPRAVAPECFTSETEVDYRGSQWTTVTGEPCLPWVHATSIMSSLKNDKLFQDGSVVAAVNYCRNPTRDLQGPFCFVHDSATNLTRQEYCHPRKCQTSGNRISKLENTKVKGGNPPRFVIPVSPCNLSFIIKIYLVHDRLV
jgi:hypothetical protein